MKSVTDYHGVFERNRMDGYFAATLSYYNWAPATPTGKDCVNMAVGNEDTKNGMWQDVDCLDSMLYGICEYIPVKDYFFYKIMYSNF